ncbi:MAG: ERF family protein [Prochloron sp. SP5CPC1]|nr:ERF family protein [Candidatus Paraprochloron terpiosi SP5CPC1]
MEQLNKKLAKIQSAFKSKKSRYNSFGKYYFRSAEDILEGLKPFIASEGVTFTVDEELKEVGGIAVIKSTATITDGTDSISKSALAGVDMEQKGMQMPQRFGSASSYAKKYALGNLLLIDDTQDADASNDHGKTAVKTSFKDKPWLNKGTPEFEKAMSFVKDQASYDKVRAKYNMSNEVNEKLLELL